MTSTDNRVMSIAICLLMITSISASITQNVGQPQNVVLSGPSPTSGGSGGLADSPWPMFGQNVNHTGLSPHDTSRNQGNLRWRFLTGGEVESSPAIGSDGTIYVGSYDKKLYAINLYGTEKWNFTTKNGIYSSPAISFDGTIYIGSADSKLYAINLDGTEKWNFTTGGLVAYSSPAIGSDGTIYVGSFDNKLYAINPDGIEKWDFMTGDEIRSSPAIGSDGTIYVGSDDNKLYAINPDGTEKWNFTTGWELNSSPSIGSDGTIYIGSAESIDKLYAINSDGTEKWSFTTGGSVRSSPAIGSDGTIYVGSYDHKLYAINPDGTEKWSFTTKSWVRSSPAIGSDGTIYVGSQDNKLYAINQDGTQKWNFTTKDRIYSSPAIGSDGTIYVGSHDFKLYAIGSPSLNVNVTSHFSELNSAAQSAITVHVTDGTNPVQGATVNLASDNGGIFSPQSGITDANGDFESIFNAPTVTIQVICRISAEVNKNGYNNGSDYVDVTINPIPWPMFGHNCRRTGLSPYDTSSNPGKLKWSYTTGGAVRSPVIGSDGTIYVGSNDRNLYAINEHGTEEWRFTTGDVIHTSPAISADGTIYVGSDDCKLYAINPDGTQKWSYTVGYYALHSSPAVGFDGTIYIGSYDNRLLAINLDGTLKWQFTSGDHIGSSPAIGSDGTIYVGSRDKKLYAIYPNGVKKWSFTTGGPIYPSPAIGSDGTIYVGSEDNKLYAINPDGTQKWDFTTDSYIYSSPAIGSDGTIYVGSEDNYVYAINPNGTERWSFMTGSSVPSSPAIGSDGTIYVGSYDNKLYAIGEGGTPPIANAGPDITVNEDDTVHFDASASYDQDGTIEFYEWDFDSSDGLWWEIGAVSDATGPTATHTYGDDGRYTVTLKVIDDSGAYDNDTCFVTVNNVAPTLETITIQGGTERFRGLTEEWVARYNGPGNDDDYGRDIAVDSSGNVYVTGYSWDSGTGYDYTTMAYDSSGNVLWVARYNGPGNGDDYAVSIALSISGNVYVTGYSKGSGTGWDYATVAYDSFGNEVWTARYHGPGNDDDYAQDIAVDSSEYVHVTGRSEGSGTDYDYATIKYDLYGNEQWVKRYDGPVSESDMANAIALDVNGNIYVTGKSRGDGISNDYATIKYDSLGNELWVARYNGPGNGGDWAWAIALDSSGYVYVTGQSLGSGTNNDYVTIAYDSSGNELWVARYDGPYSSYDEAYAIALDSSGIIYVTGASWGSGTYYDYATIAYDSSGNELWVTRYNGLGNGPDRAEAIALDSSGNIYVTGFSTNTWIVADYTTVAYDSSGNELWVASYDGPGNFDDQTHAIATDSSGNIYVTGISYGKGTELDYCTIKYSSLTYYECNEGSTITFTANATDPGSDDLTFIWNWGDGTPDTVTTYYNDGINPEPPYDSSSNEIKSPWGTYPFTATDTISHTYGDDGVYTITLKIEDDDGGICENKRNITVLNVDPTVTIESIIMEVEIGLRVAGRKYNNVSMRLYEDGSQLGYVSIERMPGSPDEQMAWIPVSINFSSSYSATVIYTPEDPPNIGGNPVWIYIKSKDGSINKIHHTFNVQQSKKRDSEHWNHVEPWEVDLNGYFIGLPFEITSHITDPGSDDEILTFTYGSQVKTVTYLKNPPNPDPYPSPEIKPVDITDVATLIYEGPGTLMLTVEDDDGGFCVVTLVIS